LLTLRHPQSGQLSTFFLDPNKGLGQITKVAAPKYVPRSCLIATPIPKDGLKDASGAESQSVSVSSDTSLRKGFLSQSADLYMVTPFDPLFILLPALCGNLNVSTKSKQRHFVSLDDHYDVIIASSPQFSEIIRHEKMKATLKARFESVCDSVEAGDDSCYKLNDKKLAAELLSKAERMVKMGLPASLEDKLVRKALEAPVSLIIEEEIKPASSLLPPVESSLLNESTSTETPSLSTSTSSISTATNLSEMSTRSVETAASTPPSSPPNQDDEIRELLRLKTALRYIQSVYLPVELVKTLPLPEKDFSALDARLAELKKLWEDATATRSATDLSRKRTFEDDDETAERNAAKKRKEDEEKAKKASETRAMRELKKVNTVGMKKMSDFFGKKK
jgi:hypothetical protein